jgi:lipopolysaccharide biosynthesis protein
VRCASAVKRPGGDADVLGVSGSTRSIAFYLPQFHPTPENDRWWGEGFTEWRNTAAATPRFAGHEQPHVPGELGSYDLRDPETRAAQARLAREHGIDAFCYYHYWFNGHRLLHEPFDAVLESGEPDLPFVLCWANENWTRAWNGSDADVLIAQHYSDADDLAHLRHLAPALADPRYLRVDGKPLFLVYRASRLPDPRRTTDLWRNEAARLGLGELHLVRVESFSNERGDPTRLGFDAAVEFQPNWRQIRSSAVRAGARRVAHQLGITRFDPPYTTFPYQQLVDGALAAPDPRYVRYPCVTPRWDNSPRRTTGAVILTGSTPARYGDWVSSTLARREPELLFVNAWNEWGEGAHLEPCDQWGRAYLEAHRDAVADANATIPTAG